MKKFGTKSMKLDGNKINFDTNEAVQIISVKEINGKCKISSKLYSKKEFDKLQKV